MSGRYKDHKGSSRSARDDSRPQKERERSRSPQRRVSPPLPSSRSRYSSSPSPPRPTADSRDRKERKNRDDKVIKKADEWESSEEEVPAPPPPPRISKISMGFSKPSAPIKMSIGAPVKAAPKKPTVASVFAADDDDDEPEEMPAEAKMRMRNIGRETPTSAGPNSFGKTKQGFCDAKKVFEKNLKHALETVEGRKGIPKFPQTIYKINGGSN